MSNQWHYSQDGAQYGPVDEAEIIRLIQDGELPPSTPVLKVGSMEWQPARNHACFQVEIYPKKKASKQVATSTTSTPSSGGTSQSPRRTTTQPVIASSSPAVVTAPAQKSTVLPWMVAGVAVLVLVGVLLFMDRRSDEPQPPRVVTGITNTPAGSQPVTNRPPATTGPTIPQPPAPDPQLAQRHYERGQNFYWATGGESKDYAEAAKWYRKAADMGHAEAQYNLGVMYRDGKGVLEDDKEAVVWFRKAALQGFANAQLNIGVMYASGDGVLEDDKEAVEWYRKAALQGNASGQFLLGYKYYNGDGVVRDYVTAYAWYNIAAANGDTEAATWKDNTAKQLTPAQIIQAQALSQTLSRQIRTP